MSNEQTPISGWPHDAESVTNEQLLEYRKYLHSLFPSQFLNKKIQEQEELQKYMNMLKKNSKKDDEDQDKNSNKAAKQSHKQDAKSPTSQEIHKSKTSKKVKPSSKKEECDSKTQNATSSKKKSQQKQEEENYGSDGDDEESIEAETSDEEMEDSDYSIDEDDMDDTDIEELLKKAPKFNITLYIDDKKYDEDYDEDEDDDDDDDEDEEEDEDWDDEEEDANLDGDEDEEEDGDYEEEEQENEDDIENDYMITRSGKKLGYSKRSKSSHKKSSKSKTKTKETAESNMDYDSDTKTAFEKLLTTYKTRKDKTDVEPKMLEQFEKYMKTQEEKFEKEKQKKTKKEQKKNSREFRKLLKSKNMLDDITYFKTIEPTEQKKLIQEIEAISSVDKNKKPYRIRLIESKIPTAYKANAMRKLNSLKYMEPGSGEYYKIKHWVDSFMRIPFGIYKTLPVNISDGIDKCNDFMENAQKTLDKAVYGMDDAKIQIMQLLGQWITNPDAVGTAIAIKGPMGTGKTSIIKEGISKVLGRPFAFIALGGATDSSFLEGHSYTYEGSIWGKIVDIIMQSGCMNPVIYFDELDKVSGTHKGDEIIGILTHLTDTTQNTQYHDKYFADIDFDLSKCLFIFSYNDESKVNPILRDRMYRIETKGYSTKEKITIVRDYLVPSIERNIGFETGEVTITDDALKSIISYYTEEEKGVRNLKRCIEIIYTKLNLYRLMKPDTELFDMMKTIKVEFPFVVEDKLIPKLIKKTSDNTSPQHMYI